MASSLALDERALILAPPQLAADTSRLLTSAGINSLCAVDLANLQARLTEGAGLAIIAEQVFSQGPSALLQSFIDQQPSWSDLPIVLLSQSTWSPAGVSHHPVGNLLWLVAPYENAQLLHMTRSALRNRRRQYVTRDQLHGLQQRLDSRPSTPEEEQDRGEFARCQARKMEAIGQLAGGVAHDFNNLLTSISGSFELIQRRLSQGRGEGLDGVLCMGREAVSRAARLTHRLLAFSSRQSLHSQRIDLPTLLKTERLEACLSPSITLQVQAAKDLWPVEADDQQLQEALGNLLLNASEAMPNGGLLRIEANNHHIATEQTADGALRTGDYVRLRITDNGQGMAQSTLEHAFEPFFSTKATGQGIGLGLSMVYGFSKQSHGHITLSSEIGQGTQVELYLPRHVDQALPSSEPVPPRQDGCSRQVLIVEDDPHVRQLLCQALCENGFPCQSAADASEGLKVLRSAQPVDLLITDVGLPGMNGRQLAEIARSLRPRLPVLFITGYAETAMAREGFLGAGMHLICKPFELQQLQARVTQILGKP
ncbi:response regulator [Pseudomonas putida]|uniref:response regulator n=1 Tax=Pseudomonas putida TaxID=303 RepID=UPI0009537164|nr:response regulator [Pseudomonas putida]HBK48091.1 hybrid sensor histidine kinase/response regulator [Pseudomonas sp.]RIZ40440.1 hybrid sensor histidine kinase/response regulator [Pseudomonas putida]TFF52047.1 hybrid sensor histidine kinase/response regulator [Pseudomonas putida]TFW37354.1 response regulator [Pseudomonas putida]SIS09271.1 Signal transduction histidine kinase [Pseudomonas putida]